MAKKVIALVRTSTVAQEVETQKSELVEFIKGDGVSEENIIIVGGSGASAIKVDEQYKKNLATVYKLIEGGNIAAVYAWGVDRIGRNEEILMEFKNRLIKNNIQLVIKNPSLRLLENDGNVNKGVELAFSLFATMAKQEMETKKARFERAKKRNAASGKYNGGKIHFGYCKGADGKITENPEEKELVKLIFNLYESGEYSTTKLAEELNNRGYKMRGKNISLHFVTNMLKSTAFIGWTEWKGVKRTYPQIISKTQFNSVQKRLAANHKGDITKQTKHIHLAGKLIVCPTCGRHWFATNRSYTCIGHKYYGKDLVGFEPCPNGESISCEWVDVAAWYVAKSIEIDYIYNFTEEKAQQAQKQIEINTQKISTLRAQIRGVDAKKQRIADSYINELITAEERNNRIANIKQEVADYNTQILGLQEENKKLEQIAQFDAEGTLIHLGRLPISGIYEDAERAYKICHKHIKNIVIKPFVYQGKTQKMITINTVLGQQNNILYVAKSKVKDKLTNTIFKLFVEREGKFVPLIATPQFVQSEI